MANCQAADMLAQNLCFCDLLVSGESLVHQQIEIVTAKIVQL
jgi:hypothetical protein